MRHLVNPSHQFCKDMQLENDKNVLLRDMVHRTSRRESAAAELTADSPMEVW